MTSNKRTFEISYFPQQYEDYNKLHKFYEYLTEGRLCTTRCKDCGYLCWPPRTVCPECLSDNLEYVEMPKEGKVYSYTVQFAGVPPGYEVPMICALISFENGIKIFAGLVETKPEDVRVGSEVELKIQEVTADQLGRKRVLPFFRVKK